MPMIGEIQGKLGSAIAQAELVNRTLLNVFAWASLPGPISPAERSSYLMQLEIARASLPLIEIEIRNAIELLLPKTDDPIQNRRV